MTSPFGIDLHKALPDGIKQTELSDVKFSVMPPKPHPAFTDYYAEDRQGHGVVWLKAISPIIENDAFGAGTRAMVEKLSSQLASRYGPARQTDILHSGSIWSEPRDWMASLHQNERSYFHSWEAGKANLPQDIEMVFLGVNASDHSNAFVILEYVSSDHATAQKAADDDLANLL